MIALEARRAIESLRSGVPSAAAVRAIGCGQPDLVHRIQGVLAQTSLDGGLLVRAGYGEGKSHFLTCLERAALDAKYAASRVVISKQVPLSDPVKVITAASEGLRIGIDVGRGLDQVHDDLRNLASGKLAELADELEREDFDSRFPATALLWEQSHDDELRDRILRFWAGDKLGVSNIRRPLKELGLAAAYRLGPIKLRELALQRLRFIPRLLKTVGRVGWVLLLDEVELIGQYSRLGRARAYGELARLLNNLPGVITVAAISSDFSQAVLDDKGDRDGMRAYLAGRYPELIEQAEAGMAIIDRAELFVPPDEERKRRAYVELRRLYREAYRWSPPDIDWPHTVGETTMRIYVRAWINTWDLKRLHPDSRPEEAELEVTSPTIDYGEDPDLESTEGSD
ncbi:MAG: BREX system ATP-binding domain-containing protein [Actinomycetota bacterium]